MNITARDLCFKVGRLNILEDIQINFLNKQFIGILGPSGSGKSTLLTGLSGRRAFSKGEVEYDGGPLIGRPGETIGFVPQDDNLHIALRTDRLLTYSARLQFPDKSPAELEKMIDLILRSVGLEERKTTAVKKLSGGQRKRVSIAQELLLSPRALFLDEPTSGLDPELERAVMKLCSRLAKEGRLIVMTTHIMESVKLFDRLLILVAGRTAFFGTPDEALAFFAVDDVHLIYPLLAKTEPTRFPEKYKSSLLYRNYFRGAAR